MQELESVIQLVVPPEARHDDALSKERKYTVQELNDLQSKLMLVAGRADMGKEDVDRFVDVSMPL